ncbi:Inorganic_diphosphatase [Hexamita inflata]|uniref:Inorganic diphosphatase n=1 Tax=Hexamita inflata TaxID=28002 RepID=A0AA86UZS7_9EUKA|nr:Inorganic diphosphatase [Hexamita inflata]
MLHSAQQFRTLANKQNTTDAVCSAVSYAYLQRHIMNNGCKAVVTGQLRPATKYVLDKFNIPHPEVLSDIHPRPSDIKREQLVYLNQNDSLARSMELYSLYKVRILPCVDDNHCCVGMVTFHDIVSAFISPLDSGDLNSVETNVSQVVKTLSGITPIQQTDTELKIYEIYTISSSFGHFKELFKNYTEDQFKKTIFISTDNPEINEYLVHKNAGMLIVCSDEPNFDHNSQELSDSDELYMKPQSPGRSYYECAIPVIYTPKRTTEATVLIKQSTPVKRYMSTDSSIIVNQDVKLDDIARKLNQQKDLPGCAIVDKEGKLVNVITRHDVGIKNILNVTLIGTADLNCIPGLQAQGVTVKSIIDNHQLSRYETSEPVEYYIRPTAATSTIVANIYSERNVVPPVSIAGLLLAGILGATQLLKSPRTTVEDAKTAQYLSLICGLEMQEFGRQLSKQIKLEWDFDAVISREQRNVQFGQGRGKIFSSEVTSFEQLTPQYLTGLKDQMQLLRETKDVWAVFGLISDINKCESVIIVDAVPEVIQQFGQYSEFPVFQNVNYVFKAGQIMSKRLQLQPLLQKIIPLMIIE